MRLPVLLGILIVVVGLVITSCADAEQDQLDLYKKSKLYTTGVPVTLLEDAPLEDSFMILVSISEAMDLLPAHFQKAAKQASVYVSGSPTFCRSTWASGCVLSQNTIGFHVRPEIDSYPYPWEHFAEDGYTYVERLIVTIHEFGHVVSFSEDRSLLQLFKRAALELRDENPPTRYGARLTEDFADSFTFFVLWPHYLKDCCPGRYLFFKEHFGVEYKQKYSMPSSLCSQLSIDNALPNECQ